MRNRDIELDQTDLPPVPLDNPPLDWVEEDREIEDKKPDLAEIEEDELSEI